MLPFAIGANAAPEFDKLTVETSAVMSDALNGQSTTADNHTRAAALAIVMTTYMIDVAAMFDVDPTDLFDGIREAIESREINIAFEG